MKTKILKQFLKQKLSEIKDILLFKTNYSIPDTVRNWFLVLIYGPLSILAYYWIGRLTIAIIKNRPPFDGEEWIAGIVGVMVLFIIGLILSVIYYTLLEDVISAFKDWISDNWQAAKRKVERDEK